MTQATLRVQGKKFRRRTYFLYRFQTKYALALVALSALIAALIAFACFRAFSRLSADLLLEDAAFEKNLTWLVAGVAAFMISSFGSFYLLIAFASQRVTAPLALLTHYLAKFAEGQFPQIPPHLKHDELREVFALLQSAIDQSRARHLAEVAILQQALQLMPTIKTASDVQEVQKVQLQFQSILRCRFKAADHVENTH